MTKTKPPCFEPHANLTPEARCTIERTQARIRCDQIETELERLRYIEVERAEIIKARLLPDDEFMAQLDARRAERKSA